jgi:hypothetical protein
MEKITSIAELKNAIQLLEIEQAMNGQLLKEQINTTVTSIKPVNLFKRAVTDAVSSPFLIDNILNAAIGLTSGYLSKKIFIGASGNIFRKLFGSVLQLGVTTAVAEHPGGIRSFGQFIFKRILRRRVLNAEKT